MSRNRFQMITIKIQEGKETSSGDLTPKGITIIGPCNMCTSIAWSTRRPASPDKRYVPGNAADEGEDAADEGEDAASKLP